MNEFGLNADDEALDYMRLIAAEMQALFGVSADDAAARMKAFWGRSGSFRSEYGKAALLHERPSTWAKNIYYGRRDWWRNEP